MVFTPILSVSLPTIQNIGYSSVENALAEKIAHIAGVSILRIGNIFVSLWQKSIFLSTHV